MLKTRYLFLIAGLFYANILSAQENVAGKTTPLFQSDDLLKLDFEADFDAVFAVKDDSTEFPAKIYVIDNNGERKSLDVQIRTRGKTRREMDVCWFFPLRVNFKKKEADNTPFEGQNILKLVTHCNKSNEFEQNTILEYLIYKAFNVLTDSSFEVRPAMINYIDITKKTDTLTRFAFFIEREKYLARRLNMIELEDEKIHPMHMDEYHTCLMDIFQYMVGNTDYSAYTLHNMILLSDSLRANPTVPVPYDFDWSGIISARYAVPHPMIHTDEVEERVYRGFKKDSTVVYATLRLFNARKEQIIQVFEDCPWLNNGRKKEAVKYLESFYKVINNERSVQREFFDNARYMHN